MDLLETGIVNDTLIGPFGVPERFKINSRIYIATSYRKTSCHSIRNKPLLSSARPSYCRTGNQNTGHTSPRLSRQDGLQRRPFNDVAFQLVGFKPDREPVGHSKTPRICKLKTTLIKLLIMDNLSRVLQASKAPRNPQPHPK